MTCARAKMFLDKVSPDRARLRPRERARDAGMGRGGGACHGDSGRYSARALIFTV
jgi:hypothetical protein